MAVARKHLGAAVLGGLMYAVGGRNQTTELSSVERYDTELDQWTSVASMTCCRSGVGLAVVNSRLYAGNDRDLLLLFLFILHIIT